MVHGNINEPQRSEVGHSLGKLSGERVVVELNLRESGEASERTRDGTVEVVEGEVQDAKVDEVPEGFRDGAHEVAAAEPERF